MTRVPPEHSERPPGHDPQEEGRKNKPTSHVTRDAWLHELVSAELRKGMVADESRHHTDVGVDTVDTIFDRTKQARTSPGPK